MELHASMLSEAPESDTQLSDRNSQHGSARSNYCDVCGLGPAPPRFMNEPWVESNIGELMQSAQSGCRACASIVHFLISQRDRGTWLRYDLAGPSPVLSTHAAGSHHTTGVYEFFTIDHTLTGKQRGNSDPFPEHPIIRQMSEPSGNTSSAKCFNTMMEWISRCRKEHALCNSTTGENLPHRVLEIQCLRPLRVRVVEGGSRRGKYACLSYRWGPSTKSTSLNRCNLNLYKTMIPRRKLYPLVRDAITIAYKVQLRYIWIDAYCILQDSKEDWEKESSKMGSIYENAFLTISASDSDHGRTIFSSKTPKSFPVTELNGDPVFIRKILRHPCRYFRKDEEGPEHLTGVTLKRAWVYQERLLSRRFIHFNRDEIFWECRESTWCECGSASESWSRSRGRKPRMLHNQDWEFIARQYDPTELSYEDDRLPALAGVARRFAEVHGKTYLAGHWVEDLPSSLAWYKSSVEPRPLHNTTPTWSWASLPRGRETDLYFLGLRLPVISLLSYNRKQPGIDIYAGAKQTEITVGGHVLDMKIYKQKSQDRGRLGDILGRAGQAFLTMRPNFDMDPEDPTKYQFVPDGASCSFLLLARPGEPRPYHLVGILLLQRISTDGKTVTFERIGYLDNHDLKRMSHLDESGEFEDYCGGEFAPIEEGDPTPVPLAWLWGRAEKREITLV